MFDKLVPTSYTQRRLDNIKARVIARARARVRPRAIVRVIARAKPKARAVKMHR